MREAFYFCFVRERPRAEGQIRRASAQEAAKQLEGDRAAGFARQAAWTARPTTARARIATYSFQHHAGH